MAARRGSKPAAEPLGEPVAASQERAARQEAVQPDASQQQAARQQAVRQYRSLDAPTDGSFDRIARIAATVFATPIATVTIVDEDAVWFAAAEGLEGVTQVGTEPGLCSSAILQRGPYVVDDAVVDPRTMAHPLVRGALGLRFYAAAPITTSDGHALGTVNVIDRRPRKVTDVQLRVLTDLADEVAAVLELKLSAMRAVRTEREHRQQEQSRHQLAEQLKDAAATIRDRPHPSCCELGGPTPCPKPPDLKIADSWGDSAWGCFEHGEDALVNVPSVFLATQSDTGIASYRRRAMAPQIARGSAPGRRSGQD